MSQPEEQPKGDPWHAFGYIVAGVAFYGFLGWLADEWLGTRYLVAVGILAGAGFRSEPARPPQDPDQNDE
jgi:ATP synthase protein I